VYCKPEGGRNLSESGDHINLSVPTVEPLYPSAASNHTCKSSSSHIPPRRIALCGGGVRCVAHIGVLKALREAGTLSCVKEMIGISAGALISLLWVLDFTIEQAEQLSLEIDFLRLISVEPDNLLMFPITLGFDNGQHIDHLIVSILKSRGFSPDATFEDLGKRHKIHLRCFATELQTYRVREFSTLKTPKTSVRFALRASMSLPLVYTPVKDGDILLVDGGVIHNLPYVFLNEKEKNETLAVLFIPNTEPVKPITDIIDMMLHVYDSSTFIRNSVFINHYHDKIICIPSPSSGTMNFQESKDGRKVLIGNAYKKTKEFLSKVTKPARRYSAS
jgi:predicted acylesterase/phospholipase RssA